jgi:hypothetical protein
MVPQIKKASHNEEVAIAQAETPELEKVHWLGDPGLRKLYFYAAIVCVASATTGYDGYVFTPWERSLAKLLADPCSTTSASSSTGPTTSTTRTVGILVS